MVLVSFGFVVFLCILLFIYYTVPKQLQWLLLLAGSVFFYAFGGVKYVAFVFFLILAVYGGGLLVERSTAQNKKKALLAAILGLVFLPLVVFKYFDFMADNMNHIFSVFGAASSIPQLDLLLPLGISFCTFQAAGYVIDVYRGVCAAQKNLLRLALFVAFFPSVSLGPINRYNDLFPQLASPHSFDYEQIAFGAQRILWGFFKKLVVADRIAILVNTVYGNPEQYVGFYVVIAAIAFAVQLYADFSGCMDIVIGAAQLFGITLPENFKTPFFSRSISEFWRRWHITLGGVDEGLSILFSAEVRRISVAEQTL